MKYYLALVSLLVAGTPSHASLLAPFKDEFGATKWQYVANFSSSVLILTLMIVLGFLYMAHRRAKRSNRELTEIKASLEERVAHRTASLQQTTAQLASREAYIKRIVDAMPLMLIGLNKKLEVTQWNHMAESVTGRSMDEALGMNLWEAYPTITLSPAQVKQVLTDHKPFTIKHSQRGQYYFDITLYALTEPEETGVVILVDDITKQMKAENKLVERNKVAAMGELASAMARDIGIPLQGIAGAIQLLNQQLSEGNTLSASTAQPVLAKAQQAGEQASNIVRNLLDFADSQRDQLQQVVISELIDHSIELAASLYSQPSGLRFPDIAIHRNYSQDVPAVACYTLEFQHVFLRIFRHAFYALSARSSQPGFVPAISVHVGNFYDSVWIKIQHNGVGLSPQEQQEIFEPFFSSDDEAPACPVDQRLSYSYFIVTDHHKGHMAVTSDVNVGSTFHIQLPVTRLAGG
ncbi:MAG TPA: ATP-binding protein [Spongiibacteraceae bacterium]|jgi:PAS domain S-box-containing protein|nr:ATP-binding protein [Spongiibacteraceae bacterium]